MSVHGVDVSACVRPREDPTPRSRCRYLLNPGVALAAAALSPAAAVNALLAAGWLAALRGA